MSQGELHSLALSLFIPRATLPESPFRFIVIDDPVQSMDPSRVDGLARVLQSAGKDRQVIVFTHDDRLPEAVRRLDIDATVIEVTRREGSVVEPRRSKDPVSRYIEDAMALANTDDLPARGRQASHPRPLPRSPRSRLHGSHPPPPHRQGRAPRRGGGAAAEGPEADEPGGAGALRRHGPGGRRDEPDQQGQADDRRAMRSRPATTARTGTSTESPSISCVLLRNWRDGYRGSSEATTDAEGTRGHGARPPVPQDAGDGWALATGRRSPCATGARVGVGPETPSPASRACLVSGADPVALSLGVGGRARGGGAGCARVAGIEPYMSPPRVRDYAVGGGIGGMAADCRASELHGRWSVPG